jgi:hypothetical protein
MAEITAHHATIYYIEADNSLGGSVLEELDQIGLIGSDGMW